MMLNCLAVQVIKFHVPTSALTFQYERENPQLPKELCPPEVNGRQLEVITCHREAIDGGARQRAKQRCSTPGGLHIRPEGKKRNMGSASRQNP